MRFAALDGLRGFAAVLVVTTHLTAANSIFPMNWVHHSQSLLTVFFVFSGFVIAMTYGDTIDNPRDAARFGLKRFGRLYPLHIATLSVILLLEIFRLLANAWGVLQSDYPPFSGRTSIKGLVENIFMVQGWGQNSLNTWNGPAWTISTEIVAYAVFAAIALVTKSVRTRIAMGVAAMLVAAALYYDQSKFWTETLRPSIPRCVMDFYVGYLVYYIWKRFPLKSRVIGSILEIGTIAAAFYLAEINAQGWLFLSNSLLFAVMLWAFASERGVGSWIMKRPAMVWLGGISLAIYLMHMPILICLSYMMGLAEDALGVSLHALMPVEGAAPMRVYDFGPGWVMDAFTLAVMAFVVVVSLYAHKYVEGPARAWFAGLANRWFGKRQAEKQDARLPV